MFEPPLPGRPLIGRRSVLRLLGVGSIWLVAGCRSGKQLTAPANPLAPTAPPGASPQPATTSARPTAAATTPHPTVSALSPDQLIAQRVALAEQALLGAYDAAAAAHPELAGRLALFRADHAAHLQGLVPGATPSGSPINTPLPNTTAATTTPATTASAGTSPSGSAAAGLPVSSPPASTAILHELADLERTAAAARLADVATTSGSLARLIASIGGCEAAHAALLSVAT